MMDANCCTRRDWLRAASVAAGSLLAYPAPASAEAPAAPVGVARCKTYRPDEVLEALNQTFDGIGGLGRIVKGKTVGIKINLTGAPSYRLGYAALADTHYTHPAVIAAASHLMAKAGARRIRILESPWGTSEPLAEYLLQANFEPRDLISAAPDVELVNTNYLGNAKRYSRFNVPYGGYIYPGFDLNSAYEELDVFVSLTKMKEHGTAGVTLSLKNSFGIAPATIYGTGAGADEPSVEPRGGRTMFHSGNRQPSRSAPQEKAHHVPANDKLRVPRIVVDLVAARPIHLAIVEGITTMTGGEGPWISGRLTVVKPGILLAGTNPVCTDAVGMSLMGFDPMADRGTPPFEVCDNTLKLAEEVGIGTRDLKRIEVAGVPVREAMFDFAKIRQSRRR